MFFVQGAAADLFTLLTISSDFMHLQKILLFNLRMKCIMLTVALAFAYSDTQAQQANNGQLYDQGALMTTRSPHADSRLDAMKDYLGQWNVAITRYLPDDSQHTSSGQAKVTFMNRGYAYMEQLHIEDVDGNSTEAFEMSFLSFNPANAIWALGEASSFTESIKLYDGDFENGTLILKTSIRHGGGLTRTMYRMTYQFDGPKNLEVRLETSTNAGSSWSPTLKKIYTRSNSSVQLMADDVIGEPVKALPAAARQFDFLLGEWNATHKILLGDRWVTFPVNATAVHALGGHGILEYSWYDVDPSLPDAATTILRIYNRATRQWESLYLANRGNALLHFGGKMEGDEMVLHLFDIDRASTSIPRFVFHDIKKDRYAWYAESSTDHGRTFNKTWTIELTRK